MTTIDQAKIRSGKVRQSKTEVLTSEPQGHIIKSATNARAVYQHGLWQSWTVIKAT